jgi:hypothetical protein
MCRPVCRGHVGLNAQDDRAVLLVAADLNSADPAGRPHVIAKKGRAVWVRKIAPIERAPHVGADVEAGPAERNGRRWRMVWRGVGGRSAAVAPAAHRQSTAESPGARKCVRFISTSIPPLKESSLRTLAARYRIVHEDRDRRPSDTCRRRRHPTNVVNTQSLKASL